MPKFEAHITLDREHRRSVADCGERFGWKFSQFDADPLLGDKPYCYLTRYDTDSKALLVEARRMTMELEAWHLPVLRVKIEEIIFDTKTGVNQIGPA